MFSIIIPTYNRPKALERTLRSILLLEHDTDIEIIVVNDYPDLSPYVLKDSRIRVINNSQNMGRSRSRNAGAAASAGEFLFFIDDDVEVTENIFRKYAEMFKRGFDAVFSNVVNVRTDGRDSALNRFLNTRGANKRDFEKKFKSNYFTTAFCAVRKTFFEKIEGFDEKFSGYGWEDPELGMRINSYGGKISFVRTDSLMHYHDKEPDEWIGQIESSGSNLNYLITKHPEFRRHIRYRLLSSFGFLVFNDLFYYFFRRKATGAEGNFGFFIFSYLFKAAIYKSLK